MKHLWIVLIILCSFGILFHPGRTDEDGGHTDSSTGEYHYHHGYPAHQHPDGKCPYEDQEPIYTQHESNGGNTSVTSAPSGNSTNVSRNSAPSRASEKSGCNRPLNCFDFSYVLVGIPIAVVIIIWIYVKIADLAEWIRKKRDKNK